MSSSRWQGGSSRRQFLKMAALAGAAFGGRHVAASAQVETRRTAQENTARRRAKNVIFMVADGMNTAALAATRQFQKLVLGTENVWLSIFENRPALRSLVETSSANSIVTDSAAAASCWGCGRRVANGVINVSAEGAPLDTLFLKAKRHGLNTALVTTATVTHATPAGFVASVKKRDDETAIAAQYLERGVDVILGGGAKFFPPALLKKFRAAGYALADTRSALAAANAAAAPRILGLFSESHMPFSIDVANPGKGDVRAPDVPTLAEMTAAALRHLDALPSQNGFILQVEGARVDHAAHANDAAALLHDMFAFDATIATALAYVDKHPDTLLILTTDHGCGGINTNGVGSNYTASTRAFQSLANHKSSYSRMARAARQLHSDARADYLKSVTGIAFGNEELAAVTRALVGDKGYSAATMDAAATATPPSLARILQRHTGVGWTSGQHTGDLCELTALGPGAERFTPFLRNDRIHNLLLAALGLPTTAATDAAAAG